jgi:hypothetical protein
MRMLQSTLVILVLALAGCTGDSEEPAPAPTQVTTQPFVAPTALEVAAYRQDLAQMFAKSPDAARRSARRGSAVDATGHSNVVLIKLDAQGQIDSACADNEQDALRFLSSAQRASDGLEVK